MNVRLRAKCAALAVVCLVSLGISRSAGADSINLAWDRSTTLVAGYAVYVTPPSGVSTRVDVGNTTFYTYSNAIAGQRYCFAVSAYVLPFLEGPRSNPVCGYSDASPTLANPGNLTSTVGQPVAFQLQGSDPAGQPLTYSATGLPAGLSLMASTGFISGTPTTTTTYSVTAKASDGKLTASQSFAWTISSTGAGGTYTAGSTGSWSLCAREGGTCTFSGTQQVRFGANGLYAYRTLTGGTACTNAVFGDPAPGLPKQCDIAATSTSTGSWSLCANEGGVCAFTGTQQVRFGANGLYAYKTLTGSTACTTAVFGDPAPGIAKQCHASTTSATSSWTVCANEGGVCSFTGTKQVRYGANGLYAYKTLTGGTPCTYSVFGDPAPGIPKQCATASTATTSTSADTTAPTVTIQQPTSGSTYTTTSGAISLSGISYDYAGVTQVTWTNSQGMSANASLTSSGSWTTGSIALMAGSNTITIRARDAAGNTATDTLSVTSSTTTTATSLRMISLTSNRAAPQPASTATAPNTITFTATATGGVTPYEYKWWINAGSGWVQMRSWSTSNTLSWTPSTPNWAYQIGVWVRDAGSTSEVYEPERTAIVAFPIW